MGPGTRRSGRALAWVWRVEGYPQPDLDLPAGDVDVFDEQPEQVLPLRPVELVYHFADLAGEVGAAAAEQVPVGQGGALGGEGVTFCLEVAQAAGDFGGAAVQLGHVDEGGLVEVGEP